MPPGRADLLDAPVTNEHLEYHHRITQFPGINTTRLCSRSAARTFVQMTSGYPSALNEVWKRLWAPSSGYAIVTCVLVSGHEDQNGKYKMVQGKHLLVTETGVRSEQAYLGNV